jgi:ABC-type multidrug transport system ATPase subunit
MIRVVNVTHHYGLSPVLKNISLTVKRGEVICVMGPNGMGKSTLLSIIAGILPPVRGHVEIDGKRRHVSPEEERYIRKKLMYLPDQPWLPANKTGREFILAVGVLYETDDLRLIEHAQHLLDLFHLEKKGDTPIASYSTGERKKIGLCAALIACAPILILDEPFSGGLDPSGLMAARAVLKHLADRDDITIVMATPVPELVEGVADRIAILKDGQILACDTPDGLRRQSGCGGNLQEVLEKLIHPETANRIEAYFKEHIQ